MWCWGDTDDRRGNGGEGSGGGGGSGGGSSSRRIHPIEMKHQKKEQTGRKRSAGSASGSQRRLRSTPPANHPAREEAGSPLRQEEAKKKCLPLRGLDGALTGGAAPTGLKVN